MIWNMFLQNMSENKADMSAKKKRKVSQKQKKKKRMKWFAFLVTGIVIIGLAIFAGWYFGTGREKNLFEGRAGAGFLDLTKSMEQWSAVPQEARVALQEEAEKMLEETKKKEKLIVIDAGHQTHQNSETEPVGPGASEMKAKVSSGTAGITTGIPEYEVVLDIALFLQQELEERGYQVIMVRTTHDVNISNSERAAIANENQADVFVRIHCDGSENTSVNGAMTICMTPSNPYCGYLYEDSKRLSAEVLNHMCEVAGANPNKVWETDTMSGINWSQVPVTIIETGYLTNPEEEQKLVSAEYQQKLAKGIADGIEAYLETKNQE